jgi:hypothetical protein
MFLQNVRVYTSSVLPKGLAISKEGFITNRMEKITSWEADSWSPSQVTPRLLQNLDIHYRLQKPALWTPAWAIWF